MSLTLCVFMFKTYQSHFLQDHTDTYFPKHKFNNEVASILGALLVELQYLTPREAVASLGGGCY